MAVATTVDRYLTPAEVAQLLGVDTRTVRRYVTIGILPPPLRLGHRTVRYPERVVARALEKLRQRGPGEESDRCGALLRANEEER